ncbi:MAG: alpha/beta hydrolase [Planctomycetaceae bacterium]|nr:alpha/beta hydrolase [Planctomycetaceae bacterium]
MKQTPTLFYDAKGSGQTAVLIHGYPFNSQMWNRVSGLLAEDFRVIVPDLRGFRKSPPPEGTLTTSMETFADDLRGLLREIGVNEKVILAGLSMGGYITMQFAAKYADSLAGMVLCGTKTTADMPQMAENRRKQAAGLRDGSLTLAGIAETMIPKLFAETTQTQHPEIIQELRNIIIDSEHTNGVAAAALGMAERTDTTDVLRQLQIPVHVICGAEDRFSPPDEMRQLARYARNSTFTEIAGAGHLPPMEQPEQFAAAFRRCFGA